MELKVIVYRRPNMFKVQENLYNLMGLGELKNLFTIEGYKTNQDEVTWFYPERFLNILEQRLLAERAEKAGFKRVTIVTHSVYILQTVNNTNILSQGSGFLQVAEIFSSLEYTEAALYILLIDEPDSHLHTKLQKKLIEEFRTIDNSQLFIISHNDRFLNEVQDGELLLHKN